MTFHQPGSAPIAWLVLAVAAASAASASNQSSEKDTSVHANSNNANSRSATWLQYMPALVCVIAFVPLARLYAVPLTSEQSALALADAHVRQSEFSIATLDRGIKDLKLAEEAMPIDPKPYQWQVRFHLHAAEMTRSFRTATMPPLQQLALDRRIDGHLADALATVRRARDAALRDATLKRLEAEIHSKTASLRGNVNGLKQATVVLKEVVEMKPYSWQDRLDLADLYWKLGQRNAAVEQYKTCLEVSDQAYLDEARQIPAPERARIQANINTIKR